MSVLSRLVSSKQQGFILSIEAVLLFTVVGIGLMLGLSILRDALIRLYVSDQEARFVVADSGTTPKLVGVAVGFDEYQSPLLVFTDYDPLGTNINFRALIGARADRFTSHQLVMYESSDCSHSSSMPVCVTKTGSFPADTLIRNLADLPSALSSIYALQGNGPVYAVGRGLTDSDQGRLFRGAFTTASAPEPINCPATALNSVWVSVLNSTNSCVALPSSVSGADLLLFQEAVEVVLADSTTNVLQGLTPPFFTNMVGNPLTDFTSTAPTAETP